MKSTSILLAATLAATIPGLAKNEANAPELPQIEVCFVLDTTG